MTNRSIPLDKYTVQALVDGSLNLADVADAITLVQDIFNQHSVLPPYTTHLKIFEFALANDIFFEAKRHLFFIQHLWKLDIKEGNRELLLTQKNPKIGKEALVKLFHYYSKDLTDDDFEISNAQKGRISWSWQFF